MTKRKIALLAACGILLCIYIAQIAVANRPSARPLVIARDIDSIEISGAGETIVLTKDGDVWKFTAEKTFGQEQFPATAYYVTAMETALKNIRLLDTVSKSASDAERYGLADGQKIDVAAKANGATLRSISIGKAASTGAQTYIMADGAIYLASGGLAGTFSVLPQDLRSKNVYAVEADTIATASVSQAQGRTAQSYSIEKRGDPPVWAASDETVDSEKAAAWIRQIASLTAESWLGRGAASIPQEAAELGTVTLSSGGRDISLTIYSTPPEENPEAAESVAGAGGAENDPTYYAVSSESPYAFTMWQYTAQSFLKDISELK